MRNIIRKKGAGEGNKSMRDRQKARKRDIKLRQRGIDRVRAIIQDRDRKNICHRKKYI